MQANTNTSFGSLRPGDRFYFISDSKKTVFQITKPRAYNLIRLNGNKCWQYDRTSNCETVVRFLRAIDNTK